VIRPAHARDRAFIHDLAMRVFSRLGDYERILPEWLGHQGVLAFIVEEEGAPLGFTMIGFYPIGRGDPRGHYAADLLAIAVDPDAQRRGIGRLLVEHAIAIARSMRRRWPVVELRLVVAEDNPRAFSMFRAAGFAPVVGDYGRYSRGQRALHMRLEL
jgi:ribosomal protein S18 acetylase RimI-like enzyme